MAKEYLIDKKYMHKYIDWLPDKIFANEDGDCYFTDGNSESITVGKLEQIGELILFFPPWTTMRVK